MTTMLEVPPSCQSLIKPLQSLLSAVSTQCSLYSSGESVDYAAVEQQVAACAAQVESASHQLLLSHLDVNAPRVLIGGKEYVRVERSPATYYTMAGPVVVERTLYQVSRAA